MAGFQGFECQAFVGILKHVLDSYHGVFEWDFRLWPSETDGAQHQHLREEELIHITVLVLVDLLL